MRRKRSGFEEEHHLPPYGPARGMLKGLELMRRTSPSRVDGDFLHAHRVAPGNEYKVAGALRFLGLIDEVGRPTEKSRFLKTRGARYTLALQEMVHTAYRGLFSHLSTEGATREDIYNYFVTEERMGVEMAAKAARFFLALCRLAQIDLGPSVSSGPKARRTKERERRRPRTGGKTPPPYPTDLPLVLAITPEMAEMDVERLTELLRKMRTALRQVLSQG